MTNKILFLCTGNYFRSRFAEVYFNHKAGELKLNWRAESRGFATHLITEKLGPISRHTVKGLADRGIRLEEIRKPLQLQLSDLETAGLIIAVKEIEHRPFLVLQFPKWADKVEYWNIHDLDVVTAEQALASIEVELQILISRLAESAKRK